MIQKNVTEGHCSDPRFGGKRKENGFRRNHKGLSEAGTKTLELGWRSHPSCWSLGSSEEVCHGTSFQISEQVSWGFCWKTEDWSQLLPQRRRLVAEAVLIGTVSKQRWIRPFSLSAFLSPFITIPSCLSLAETNGARWQRQKCGLQSFSFYITKKSTPTMWSAEFQDGFQDSHSLVYVICIQQLP